MFKLSITPMETNIARVLLNTKPDDKKDSKTPLPLGKFDPAITIDLFPGPALLVDGQLNIIHHNVYALHLLPPLHNRDTFLKSMVSRCLTNNCPDAQKTTIKDNNGLRHYDLTALPIQRENKEDIPLVFLFGRETTIEHNLTTALVDSRQMFKDLVSCSTDFAWETDTRGNFIYVSPKGILGYTAYELNGKNSQEMIIGAGDRNPFDTLDKITEMELWLNRADGSMACLLVSAVPVLDAKAKWKGARGVCRDITHIREREASLRRANKQEHVLSSIIATIRNMQTPTEMFEGAVKATMEGIKTDFCCILQKVPCSQEGFTAEIQHQRGISLTEDVIANLCQKALEVWQNEAIPQERIQTLVFGDHQILMGVTNHHTQDNGAIFLVRSGDTLWHEDDIHLFRGITSHLGIAIEQVLTYAELERRAYTDELTGLLNRRAFRDHVNKRLKNQKRSLKSSAMVYIDLDNFKHVNDTKGHAFGDKILRDLSGLLQDNLRVGDYTARFGGDEFAIWLDEIDKEEAIIKAENLVRIATKLNQNACLVGPQLSLSIGLAMSLPENPATLDQLMDQADQALYRAKGTGKNTSVLFEPNIMGQNNDKGDQDA
tara:strand:- start:59 stop:1864 length:1806 start_codon:yes stop_codon:yes gene_type:complete